MTIKNAIHQLTVAAESVGEDAEFAVMRENFGENDYVIPSFTVIGNFEDQDGQKYKCVMVGDSGGEELTEEGIPHYEWKPSSGKVCV